LSTYQIGTRAIAVQVHTAAGTRIDGEMFLRPGALGHAGGETIADRLNDGTAFFPLKVTEPKPAVLLIGKEQVRYVVAPSLDDEERLVDLRERASQLLVTAVMADGETFTGVVFVDLPPEKLRALDYVNDPKLAFLAIVQLEREYHLNRAFVRHLEDMGG
jgi:hypothetical protein